MPKAFLVVDDDAVFRERLARALSARGYGVRSAAGMGDVLALLSTQRFDRATVDLRMPEHGGLDVVRAILRVQPEMHVVVLTGYGSIATAVEAMRLGAINYLTKPADCDEILRGFDKTPMEVPMTDAAEQTSSLARVEWEHIQRVLSDTKGNISEAARVLGMHRRSLQRKLSKNPVSR